MSGNGAGVSGAAMRDFEKALIVGRPPNVKTLFPISCALIVSGKVIDRAMLKKGQAIAPAINARNHLILLGALRAAQRANSVLIIEIAKSESSYCAINFRNLAQLVNEACNVLGITVPVAVHADHYGLKNEADVANARIEVPLLFESGITSIAIDASHMADDENLLANLALAPLVPDWAGLETEVGEIKGKEGLSTVEEARFLIQGLNAHSIFPDWIALNNGTTHGIEASDAGIQVELTAEIHRALAPYGVSGAQHGTSGNSAERLRRIARETRTTKANVATALQMISWGVEVNDYGNAILDEAGEFRKLPAMGVSEGLWREMVDYAGERGWKKGDYKKLCLPFEDRILDEPEEIRARIVQAVEEFVYRLMTEVFFSQDTAPLAIEQIVIENTHTLPAKAECLESPDNWTGALIRERAQTLKHELEPKGRHDD